MARRAITSGKGFYQIRVELDKFRKITARAARQVGVNAAEVVRDIAIDTLEQLYDGTPVDKGQASAGWLDGFRKLNAPEPPLKGTDAQKVAQGRRQGVAVVNLEGKRPSVTFTNAVPHIVPLEFGHSGQAPNGFFRRTMARTRRALGRRFVKQVFKGVRI